MELVRTHKLKIITALLILNFVATGYTVVSLQKQARALGNVATAMGQVANTFIESRIVEIDQNKNFSVNQVITAKDVQQAQQSFNAPPPIQ